MKSCVLAILFALPSAALPCRAQGSDGTPPVVRRAARTEVPPAKSSPTRRQARRHDSVFARVTMLAARMRWRGRGPAPSAASPNVTEVPSTRGGRLDLRSGGLIAELSLGIPADDRFAFGPLVASQMYPDVGYGGVKLIDLGGFAQFRPLPERGLRTRVGATSTSAHSYVRVEAAGFGMHTEVAYDWWLGEHWSAAAVLRLSGAHLSGSEISATVGAVGLGLAISLE